MIREKDLEKHKFFTTNGNDIWKVKAVNTFTLVELLNCETGGTASARVGERSAGGFMPVVMPKVKDVRGTRDEGRETDNRRQRTEDRGQKSEVRNQRQKSEGKKRGRPKKVGRPRGKYKTKTKSTAKTGRGCRSGEKPSSQYLGVTVKSTRAGEKRFYAQSARGGKWKNLGYHTVEELAAAAVQEHLGNKEEAARLRVLAKKKTGTGQTKTPATKEPDNVEHRRIFAQESSDE